jgi:hypothetical protein
MNTRFIIAITIFFLWILIWTFSYHYIENWSLIDSFYFSVTTLTTVGYWDMMPSSEISRLFTAIYILFWVTSVIWWSMAIIWTHTINHWETKIKNNFSKTRKEIDDIIEIKQWKTF